MRFEWKISKVDVDRVKMLVKSQKEHPIYKKRIKKNLSEFKPQVTKDKFWKAAVCMRLTSRQRSGPESRVAQFRNQTPFPLARAKIVERRYQARYIARTLRLAHIRDYNIIAQQLTDNLVWLESEGWEQVIYYCNQLTMPVSKETEAEVADYLNEKFIGFGPKQARNVLQFLGLTRFEIPIDSRMTKWLNANGFPMRINATALADKDFYRFILDGIQFLCKEASVYPCLFDAAVFAAADSQSRGRRKRT